MNLHLHARPLGAPWIHPRHALDLPVVLDQSAVGEQVPERILHAGQIPRPVGRDLHNLTVADRHHQITQQRQHHFLFRRPGRLLLQDLVRRVLAPVRKPWLGVVPSGACDAHGVLAGGDLRL